MKENNYLYSVISSFKDAHKMYSLQQKLKLLATHKPILEIIYNVHEAKENINPDGEYDMQEE